MPTVPDERKAANVTDEATSEKAEPDAKYYCPGCGARSDTAGECTGSAEGPHPGIAYVSTKELDGDPAKHTAAPNTGDV